MPPKRNWYRSLFNDHPGASSKTPESKSADGKMKVYCKKHMEANIEEQMVLDRAAVASGERAAVRDEASIIATLWTLDMQTDGGHHGYLIARTDTLLTHIVKCPYSMEADRYRAQEEKKEAKNKKLSHTPYSLVGPSGMPIAGPAHLSDSWNGAAELPFTSVPGTSAHPGQPSLQQILTTGLHSPGAPTTVISPGAYSITSSRGRSPVSRAGSMIQIPGSARDVSPIPSARSYSPSLSTTSSIPPTPRPYYGEIDLSDPVPFVPDTPGPSSQRYYIPSLSRSASASGSRPGSIPPGRSPSSSYIHSASAIPWTSGRQRRFESLLTRLTASANFPLDWVEDPVFHTICDEFLPAAKIPSRRVLTSRLLPNEVSHYRTQAISSTAGAEATVQADGWTGVNNHHLLAFMLTAKRTVHSVRVVDTSSERKTAEKFLKHIKQTIQTIKADWKVEVIAFTSDASGESRKARLLLLKEFPFMIVLDCYAHQINLIVGDYLDSKSAILKVTDRAEQLISWLRRRTFVLACIRDLRRAHGKKASSVLRAVKTRWTSHYHAITRLLELQSTLNAIIATDVARDGKATTFLAGITKSTAKLQAENMIAIVNDGRFWQDLARVKQHLEPLAIAAHISQAAHCRLDQILLIFGYLYSCFLELRRSIGDEVGVDAVLNSIEERWGKADQSVFVAAILLNPAYKLEPFHNLECFTELELDNLIQNLWQRFYRTPPPPILCEDLHAYLNNSGRFKNLPQRVDSAVRHAEETGASLDPIELWAATNIPGKDWAPLSCLARRILSVCANSATCERLFSLFGQLLTKLRNRLATKTLTELAELKMHVRDEYSKNSAMKTRLKRHCGAQPNVDSLVNPASSSQDTAAAVGADNRTDQDDEDDGDEADESMDALEEIPSGELRSLSHELRLNREGDRDSLDSSPQQYYRRTNTYIFSVKVEQLFDFTANTWQKRIEALTSRSLDAELELYELLDFDAEGEDADGIQDIAHEIINS